MSILRQSLSPAVSSVALLVFAYWADVGPMVFAFACGCCGWCVALAYAALTQEGGGT